MARRWLHYLLCFAGVALLADDAPGRTWYIREDGTGDAPTIQAGVDSASAGDVVLVAAGSYSQTTSILIDGVPTDVVASITKDIRLISESGPASTILGNTSADVVIHVDGVGSAGEITGFRIRTLFEPFGCVDGATAASTLDLRVGIKCRNSSIRIQDNEFSDNGIAIELNASPALVSGNTITLALHGIICRDASDANIVNNTIALCAELVRSEASGPIISNNEMFNGCSAVYALLGSSATVMENRIHDISPFAVDFSDSEGLIEGNTFRDNNLVVRLTGLIGTTVVRGNIFYSQLSGAVLLSDNPGAMVTIENNTIDKSMLFFAIRCHALSNPVIRRNIIVGSVGGVECLLSSAPTLECNNVFLAPGQRYGGDCADQTGLNGNIAVDPQFCGIEDSGNYFLQGDSPCAPGNHPEGGECELIGALGVACGVVPTKAVTWGAMKAIYGEGRK